MTITKQTKLLRSFLRKTYNREVLEWFRDIADTDYDTIATSRKTARNACLIKPKDSLSIIQMKMNIFRYVVQKVHLKPDIFGLPVTDFHDYVRYKPQIVCFWRERKDIAKANNRYPTRARYSVRYRGSYDSEADLTALKNKVNRIFNTSIPHSFDKGRKKYTYIDREKGYEIKPMAVTREDAKSVINALLEIQGDNPLDDNLLSTSSYEEKTDWNSYQTIRVAGTNHKLPQQRKTGKLYFTHAEFKVYGMTKPIILATNLAPVTPTALI